MDILIEDYRRLLNDLGEVYQRNIYQSLESDHRIIGIVGPRGIGKTTYIPVSYTHLTLPTKA